MTYCVYDYDEVADVWTVDHHKARKCCECGGPILPGERYEKIRSLYDHHWTVYRTCPRCIAALEAENAALRVDAERYRWLRNVATVSLREKIVGTASDASMDWQIDAARRE